MTRYAATTSDGQRARAETREEIDRWAAARVRDGKDVEVWAQRFRVPPVRVGRWEA